MTRFYTARALFVRTILGITAFILSAAFNAHAQNDENQRYYNDITGDEYVTTTQDPQDTESADLYAYLRSYIALTVFNNNDQARTILLDLLLKDPDNQRLKYQVHNISANKADYQIAAPLAQSLLDSSNTWSEGERNNFKNSLMIAAIAQGDWDEALNQVAQSNDILINKVLTPFYKGYILLNQGEKQQAAAEFQNLLKNIGGQLFLLQELGYYHYENKDYETALNYFSDALRLSGTEIKINLLLLTLYTAAQHQDPKYFEQLDKAYQDAQLNFPQLEELRNRLKEGQEVDLTIPDPKERFEQALYELAKIFGAQNNKDVKAYIAGQAYFLYPDKNDARWLWAQALAELGQFERGLEVLELQKLDSLAEEYKSALLRAELLITAQEFEMAKTLLGQWAQKALDNQDQGLNPILALRAKARIEYKDENYQQALADYKLALELSTQQNQESFLDWELYYSLALSYDALKDWPQAEQALLKALEINPIQPNVLNYLAYSWIDYGISERYQQALEMLQKAIKAEPNSAHIIDSLAWAYYKLGRYQEALPFMEHALNIMPSDPILNDHLGDIYYALGKKTLASYQWERALVHNPTAEERAKIEQKLLDLKQAKD